jgi:hypothetical protein
MGLAWHAEARSGLAWPSVATLASYAGCSERTARKAVSLLEATGWVRVTPRKGYASHYTLLSPPPAIADPRRSADQPGNGYQSTPAVVAGVPGNAFQPTPAVVADEQEPLNENHQREPWVERCGTPTGMPPPPPTSLSMTAPARRFGAELFDELEDGTVVRRSEIA